MSISDQYRIAQLEQELCDLRAEFDAFVRATIESARITQHDWIKAVVVLAGRDLTHAEFEEAFGARA